MCDFSGFRAPEMVKNRPVVVLTRDLVGRPNLVTVACLSSGRPDPVRDYHCLLPQASLPMLGMFQVAETWVKGDMIYTVGFHRLDMIRLGNRGPDGKHLYFNSRFSRERMKEIYGCVLDGLGLGELKGHL